MFFVTLVELDFSMIELSATFLIKEAQLLAQFRQYFLRATISGFEEVRGNFEKSERMVELTFYVNNLEIFVSSMTVFKNLQCPE